jgi:hypothetical protein
MPQYLQNLNIALTEIFDFYSEEPDKMQVYFQAEVGGTTVNG